LDVFLCGEEAIVRGVELHLTESVKKKERGCVPFFPDSTMSEKKAPQ